MDFWSSLPLNSVPLCKLGSLCATPPASTNLDQTQTPLKINSALVGIRPESELCQPQQTAAATVSVHDVPRMSLQSLTRLYLICSKSLNLQPQHVSE